MSDAFAQVFTVDGELVGYSVYQGSADVTYPALRKDFAWENDWWERCPHPVEDGEACIVYSDYGGGFWWSGVYCAECRNLHGPLSPWGGDGWYDEDPGTDMIDGHPFPELRDASLTAP